MDFGIQPLGFRKLYGFCGLQILQSLVGPTKQGFAINASSSVQQ